MYAIMTFFIGCDLLSKSVHHTFAVRPLFVFIYFLCEQMKGLFYANTIVVATLNKLDSGNQLNAK